MTECANAEMRDQLPDLLHERLDRDARAALQAHLATCGDCRAELELLRTIRAAALTPRIDTARIAAAVSSQRQELGGGAGNRFRANAASSLFPLPSSLNWRIAAAIALIVLGGTSVATVLRHRGEPQMVASLGGDSAAIVAQMSRPELQLGDAYTDLTDAQLSALLKDIPKLDGLPVSEPDVDVLIAPLPGNGGT